MTGKLIGFGLRLVSSWFILVVEDLVHHIALMMAMLIARMKLLGMSRRALSIKRLICDMLLSSVQVASDASCTIKPVSKGDECRFYGRPPQASNPSRYPTQHRYTARKVCLTFGMDHLPKTEGSFLPPVEIPFFIRRAHQLDSILITSRFCTIKASKQTRSSTDATA